MALTNQERLERIGKYAADLVEDGTVVGLGTGSTAAAMVDALGVRVREEGLRVIGVATSIATSNQASLAGIALKNLDDVDRLDLCIDGADEIDPAGNLVKGAGGALLFEKLVARRANHFVIISSDEKLVKRLGMRMPLPVEVVSVGWKHTAEEITGSGLKPSLRRKDGRTFITDGGHYILDCSWPESALDPINLATNLKAIVGVVEHGLFIDMADSIVTINPEGEIQQRDHTKEI